MFKAQGSSSKAPSRPIDEPLDPSVDTELTDRSAAASGTPTANLQPKMVNPRTSPASLALSSRSDAPHMAALRRPPMATLRRPDASIEGPSDAVRDETIDMIREAALSRRDGDIPGLSQPAQGEPTVKVLKRMTKWLETQDGFVQHLNNLRVPIQKHLPGIVATLTARAGVTAGIDAKYLDISEEAKTILQNVNLGVWTLLEAGQAASEELRGVATRQSRIGHATSLASYVAGFAVSNGMHAAGAVSEVGLMINLYVALRDSYNAYALTKSNVHNPPDETTGQTKLSVPVMALGGAAFGLSALAFSPAMNTPEAHDAADTVLGHLQSVAKKVLAGFGSAGDTMPLDVVFDLTMAYGGAYHYGVKKTMPDGSEQHVKGFEAMKAVKTWLDYQPFALKDAVGRILKQQATTGMARSALLQSYNAVTPFFDFVQEKTMGLGNHDNIAIVGGKAIWFGVTVSPMFLERPYLKKPLDKKDEEGAGEQAQPGVFQPVVPSPNPPAAGGVGATTDAADTATLSNNPDPLYESGANLFANINAFGEAPATEPVQDARLNPLPGASDMRSTHAETSDSAPASIHLEWPPLTNKALDSMQQNYPDFGAFMTKHFGRDLLDREAAGEGNSGT